jgi:membrane protein YdbS with pleckstrin-like domain
MRATPLPDLRPSEDVVWHAGQHWWAPARRAALPALLALLCLVVALGSLPLRATWPAPWPLAAPVALGVLAALALGRLVWVYLDWVDDALILTTERVVWLQKTAFFHEQRREIPLHRVQNVAVTVDGLLARWLGYGDVVVEAAGAPPIAVMALPQPHELRQRLFALQAWRRAQHEQQDRAAVDAAVRAALGLPAPPALPTAATTGEAIIHLPSGQRVITGAPAAGDGLLTWRRHWWYLLAGATRPALLLALAIPGAVAASRLPGAPGELLFALTAALVAAALAGAVALVWAVLAWRAERYVLDGDRLLDIAGAPFGLRREVKETSLARVQDVSYCIPHPLAHLLDFGDVIIQTGGETQRFTFDGVAGPRQVHAAISRRLASARAAEAAGRQRQVRDEVLSLLSAYHQLVEQRGAGGGDSATDDPPATP